MNVRLITILGIVLFMIAACNDDEGMLLSYQHSVQVGVYSRHTGNDTTLTEVKVYGIGREDSLLYDEPAVKEFFLNLNMHQDTTRFAIQTHSISDELTFIYSRHTKPASGSAGITMEMKVDSVSSAYVFIDSVAITYPYIKYNESIENVQIYIY
ncbi:MAG: DUF6452 family protein [Bacteroidales bacterium]|nr:DUF6452 family protein [Bacteroidales bacterium]